MRRVVDKMLTNAFHVGLIAILFPLARVIQCRRDWRDVVLSCYDELRNPGAVFHGATWTNFGSPAGNTIA